MVGIYKITNLINGHCYIGQSTQIEKRWSNHKIASNNQNDKSYNYPLYKAFRKYGIENFSFEVLEECSNEKLNEKEHFWIVKIKPEYNQTQGGDYQVVIQKLTKQQVEEIQQLLISDTEGKISHKELAQKYNVHKDTIRDINVGRSWHDSKFNYPLHYSKFDSNNPNKIEEKKCIICGKEIWKRSTTNLCLECFHNKQKQQAKKNLPPVSREELKDFIRTMPFTKIALNFGVSDNTIRKWCDKYNLPKSKAIIKTYSDDKWLKI